MKNRNPLRFSPAAILLFLTLLASNTLQLRAQIYEPDGLRIPGDWNGWVNTPGSCGEFELQKQPAGTPRWTTTFHYTGTTGPQEFKFVSTSFSNPWGNQWAGNTAMPVNAFGNLTYDTPADPNNRITATQGKWYSVVFQDMGYANTRAIFMETSAEPAEITSVAQSPVLVGNQDPVTVTGTLGTAPSPEEHFFMAFSTDNWTSAVLLPMSVSGTSCTAVIPPQPDDTTVQYYLFSSTLASLQTDWDLLTLRQNNNNGDFFSYTVGTEVTCGQATSLITTEPPFPLEGVPVTLYFNAEFGNGGLYNYTGDVYAHTGVITNLSTSSTDWKYVKTQWGQNTPETRLTRISANLYSLSITDIRQYYGVPAAEQILKMAFVFRGGEPVTGTNYPEHKNADGSDIFAFVYQNALNVKIMNPTAREPLASPNQVMPVCVEALQNQSISLYLGNQLLKTENTSSLAYPLVLQGMAPGTYWIRAVANGNSGQAKDSVSIYLRGPVVVEELPAGMKNGINYTGNSSVTLVLHDPAGRKGFAFAIGDYSNWLPGDQNYMKRTPDGKHYWVTLTGLTPQKEYAYQYYIDGKLKTADPYCDKVLDPWNDRWIPKFNYPSLKSYPFDLTTGVVSVFQTAQPEYPWQVTSFTPPAVNGTQQDLIVYELLLRDFTDSSSIVTAMEKLDYLQTLGINAVQLMPVMEFDGNESWGYAPNFFFAPDKFYGRKADYKRFIDECHQRGMAVILDIVTNHCFGQCPLAALYFDPDEGSGQPSPENPWLNPQAPHPLSVGYDFNHESPHTRTFFKEVLSYWLSEYKVDGFRFDLSKGLTQKYSGSDLGAWSAYDAARIAILTDYYNHIKSVNPNAYVILEHFADNSEETVLANSGMLLWSGMHERYKQTGIGWQSNSDLSWAYHANRGWTYPNLVDYMENHDQERMMAEALAFGNSASGYDIKDTATAIHHMGQASALFLGIPGPKMIWQFGELGYDYSILFNGERTAPKPPRWDYYGDSLRQRLFMTYSGMAKLKKSDAFRFGSFTSDLGGLGKRMWIAHQSMNVTIAANMGVNGFDMAPGFAAAGTWYDYFTGESVNVSNPAGHTVYFGPGEFRVFTSVALPKPFHAVRLTVLDSVTGAPVSGADVYYQEASAPPTGAQGTSGFLASAGNANLKVIKQGYRIWKKSFTIDNDLNATALLVKGPTGTGEIPEPPVVRLFPNPTNGQFTLTTPEAGRVEIFSVYGQRVYNRNMVTATEMIDPGPLAPGIYLVRYRSGWIDATVRLIITE